MAEDVRRRKDEIAALRVGFDLGMTLVDTAQMYADGGAEDSGADVGDVGEFEEALDGAVFAEGSVEDGEDYVHSHRCRGGLGEGEVGGGRGGCGEAEGGRLTGEEGGGGGVAEPVAGLGDADGDDVVLALVDGLEDGGGGEERDFVLAGAAAEENADA